MMMMVMDLIPCFFALNGMFPTYDNRVIYVSILLIGVI